VLSNSILRRDDQIGCPVFTPIDEAEARLTARNRRTAPERMRARPEAKLHRRKRRARVHAGFLRAADVRHPPRLRRARTDADVERVQRGGIR
jgi:hypothetical protein